MRPLFEARPAADACRVTSRSTCPRRVDPASVSRHDDHDDVRIVPVGETPAAITYRGA
jgi:hypothetical protein